MTDTFLVNKQTNDAADTDADADFEKNFMKKTDTILKKESASI